MNEDVQQCKKCRLGCLKVNEKKPFDVDRLFEKDIMVIAQNPSYKRRGGDLKIFEVETNKNDIVFKKAIEKIGYTRDGYYVTNIVKCSTSDNNLLYSKNIDIIDTCLSFIRRELKIVKPKKIIVLGHVVKTIIEKNMMFFLDYELIFINHPSYYLRKNFFNVDKTVDSIYKSLKVYFK